MGPHSFEQGNEDRGTGGTGMDWLQWGLTHSSKETTGPKGDRGEVGPLQWGLTHSSKETKATLDAEAQKILASMGPHSFEQGNKGDRGDRGERGPASMGPHSFEQGNQSVARTSLPASKKLQWGLTHSSKETCTLQQANGRTESFNGASLIRARKRRTRPG